MWGRAVTLVNARVLAKGELLPSMRFRSRVLALGGPPERGDAVVDLDGAFVLPGLVNAHDHLELNHFGRRKFRERYDNASQWIEDMRPRLAGDPAIREARRTPLRDRLFVGAMKNLLAGVTTVSHHNPLYRELRWRFPLRVVTRYGWTHSFFLEGRPVGARGEVGRSVARAHRETPRRFPFLVHLAEGVDRAARDELGRLEEAGGLTENTVLVHGVALEREDWRRARAQGTGLVWCPSSNRFLFGRTARVETLLGSEEDAVALGTDSRLTGSFDLLEELREARGAAKLGADDLLRLVTTSAARLLRLPEAGRLARGLPADFLVIPPTADGVASSLLETRRDQIRLVAVGGRPLVGSPRLAAAFAARGVRTERGRIDGTECLLASSIARRAREGAVRDLREPGLELSFDEV